MMDGREVVIFGDGRTSRDFCYVDNVVQANLLAAISSDELSGVYNVAVGERTSLLDLFEMIRETVVNLGFPPPRGPTFKDERAGDVRHSLADIAKARDFGYVPSHDVRQGIAETVHWFAQ